MPSSPGNYLQLTDRKIPLLLVRNERARRYVLRLRPDGTARVTVPGRGSISDAIAFAKRHAGWVESQLQKHRATPVQNEEWTVGTQIYFRGELVTIERYAENLLQYGTEVVLEDKANLRAGIERNLRVTAILEFPQKVLELAALHKVPVRRVVVRNQRSRWGSCSAKGTISLNWRLLQTPPFVLEYIILHELMHLRQMNHSAKYWREVAAVCPNYLEAEKWLKENSKLLR